jgi:hypothetical protein
MLKMTRQFFIPTGLKAVNVNYTTDVTTKTSGKLNAVAPATSGLSTNVSAIVTSEGTSELTELQCQHGQQVGL